LAGIASDHFQKFSICSGYGKPYGLSPGGRISTEVEPATGGNTKDRESTEKIDIKTKQLIGLKF
jgi:hypothetical protein